MPDRKFRSLEDLDKAKDEIIDKIKESKNTVEEEVSDVVIKLNNALDSASGSLNTSINVFKDRVKEAKAAFNNIYFIIIIIIVYLIIMIVKYYASESPVPSNSSVSIYSSIQKISLWIPFIAVVFISYFAVKAYRITSSIDNTDNLSTEIKNIDKNKFKGPKVPNSSQNAEAEKSSFDEKKVLLGSLITALGRSITPVKDIYEEATLLAKYQRMVKDFELCLVFYDLVKNDSFLEKLKKYPPAEVQIFNDEKSWKDIIAQKISSQLDTQVLGQKLTLSENLILLLYYEHKGESSDKTKGTFDNIVASEMEIQKLASILIHSQKLTTSSRCDYKKEDIVAVIREAKSFSLSEINNKLSESFLISDYLNSYVKFLENNCINIPYKPTVGYIIEQGKKDKTLPFEKRVINLAYDLGLRNFINNNLDSKFVDGFARASVTLKFHDDLSLRGEACKCSAEDYSTAILWSYFEKIKENDGQKVVLIKRLTKDKETVNLFLSKLKDPDINFFQSQLKDGEWYDSSFALLRKFFDESRVQILEKLSNAKEYQILRETIELNFQEVSIGTIEKLIDAQLFGAYVIMFNSGSNQDSEKSDEDKKEDEDSTEKITLSNIIDKLSMRNLGPNGDKRWDFRDEEIKKGIEKTYGIYPKYDFINFSHSTRIGILNKDQSFQDFKDEFLNNVRIILNLQKEKFNIGIVVLKIMPSDYSFGVLKEDGISGNIQIKDLNAVKYIARLGSTRLPLEDQASAMKFEKGIDLLKIVNEKSFYEIVRVINDDINGKEKEVLEEPELINQLLYELNENMSIKDFKSLALDLKEEYYEEETIQEITRVIESVLNKRYLSTSGLIRKAKYRPGVLSNRFIQSLKNLASLYKLQKRQ